MEQRAQAPNTPLPPSQSPSVEPSFDMVGPANPFDDFMQADSWINMFRLTVSASPVPPPPQHYRLLHETSESGMPVFFPAFPEFRLPKDNKGMPQLFDLYRENSEENFVLARGADRHGLQLYMGLEPSLRDDVVLSEADRDHVFEMMYSCASILIEGLVSSKIRQRDADATGLPLVAMNKKHHAPKSTLPTKVEIVDDSDLTDIVSVSDE